MGEIGEDIQDGFRCAVCCDIMSDMKAPGYPRVCLECRDEEYSDIGEFDED